MTHAVILSITSDIGVQIARRLVRDEWRVTGTYRSRKPPSFANDSPFPNAECVRLLRREYPVQSHLELDIDAWDLMVVCSGLMGDGGVFDKGWQFDQVWDVNYFSPLRLVRSAMRRANHNALVVWFAGTNPNKPAIGSAAYHLSKLAVISTVEQMDAESDKRFVAIGPGYIPTKIHARKVEGLKETNHDALYDLLMRCWKSPKEQLGRNIHIRDAWKFGPDTYKLRRCESR